MRQQMYAMHDSVKTNGMFRIAESEAKNLNESGHGIFITVNDFSGARQIKNIKRVNAWAVDIDTGTKEEMATKIRSGLTPSLVVETKRGYHVWFLASDAEPEYWNAIVLDRLVPFYGADKNARDLCRVLRMPGYLHLKNPSEPFLVQKVFEWKVSYSQKDIRRFYPDKSEPVRKEFVDREKKENGQSADFWENVFRLDCMDALDKLSGTKYVNHEEYSFIRNSNGKFNIEISGKGTSCFIDAEFKIGSLSKGGPTIFNWLRWYGISPSECIRIIKELYPELELANAAEKI